MNVRYSNIAVAGDQAYSQVQVALLPKKLFAIEEIWKSILAWDEMATASMFVSMLPLDWVDKHGSATSTKETFERLLGAPKHLEFLKERKNAELMRPFVSESGWALYSAYHNFYIARITKAAMLTISGINHVEYFGRSDERRLIQKSAPKHVLDLYDVDIMSGTNKYLSHIKEKLIEEFMIKLSGTRESSRAAINAVAIQEAANELALSVVQQPKAPGSGPIIL